MKVIGLFLLFIIITFFKVRKMKQQNNKKDIVAFSGLMLLAAYLSLGALTDIYIPNPTNGLIIIFSPIQEWIFNLLS